MTGRDTAGRGIAEIAIALDFPDPRTALSFVEAIGAGESGTDRGGEVLKVGLELFTAGGPALVRAFRERGHRIFLDLKLHDIPATVAGAVRAAGALGVDFLTLHAGGGRRMLEAAVEAALDPPRGAGGGGPLRLLGVTVLTSASGEEIAESWGRDRSLRVDEEVLRLAALARDAGVPGVVASAREARLLRNRFGEGLFIVTPGIRPAGIPADDQRRVASPADAVRAGADLLVIGRAVTRASDPRAALEALRREIAGAGAAHETGGGL